MSLLKNFKSLFKFKTVPSPSKIENNVLTWESGDDLLEVIFETNGTVIKNYKSEEVNCDVLWVAFGKELVAKPYFANFFRKKRRNAKEK